MQISIRHVLTIGIGEGLPRAVQHLLLTPQSSGVQTVREWQLEAPGMDDATGFIDAFGNRAQLCSQTRPEPEFTIVATGIVETHDRAGVVGRLDRDPVPALFRRVTTLTKTAGSVTSRLRTMPGDGRDRIPLLHALMARVGELAAGDGVQQAQKQEGQSQSQSQQDVLAAAETYAHAFIGGARVLDIPARYVTGYVLPEDGPAAFHAWAEAWDEGLGWIGFDPMLGHCPTERHVRVACGLDAQSTMPVRSVPAAGALLPGDVRMEVAQ
jgi:transglutaminase-like putative cysteine protease